MNQSLRERLLFWFCDAFGHAKTGSKNASWNHNGMSHYGCVRCGRIVSKPAANQQKAANK